MSSKDKTDNPENRGRKRPMPPEAWRFKPGVSGNPGGRPGSAPVAAAYRKFLKMPLEKIQSLDTSKLTGAELVALATLKAAWKGRVMAAVEATDRSEGKVPIAAKVDTAVDLAGAFRDAAKAMTEMDQREELEDGRKAAGRALLALPAHRKPDA